MHRPPGSSAQSWLKYDKIINPGLSLHEHKHASSTPKLILDAPELYLLIAWTNKPCCNTAGAQCKCHCTRTTLYSQTWLSTNSQLNATTIQN